MSSEFEDLDPSAACKKLGNSERGAGKYDRSLGIGFAWINALTLAWIATLFLSLVTVYASIP